MSSLKNTALLSLFFLNSWIGIELPVLCFSCSMEPLVPFPAYRKFHFRSTGPSPPPANSGEFIKETLSPSLRPYKKKCQCRCCQSCPHFGSSMAPVVSFKIFKNMLHSLFIKTCYIPSLLKLKKIFHRFSTILIKHC